MTFKAAFHIKMVRQLLIILFLSGLALAIVEYAFECAEDGLFPDDNDCTKFYQCTHGNAYHQKCFPGLHYDVVTKTCTWKNQAHCGPYTAPVTNISKEELNSTAFRTHAPLCEADLLPCATRDFCIERDQFCDEKLDCPQGTDELFCDQDVKSYEVPECNTTECLLPDCFCSSDGTSIPGDLPISQVPQIIMLTFDDAVNTLNERTYSVIFHKKHKNPNGCPITGTFFVSHEYTDYYLVKNLYTEGHEIASHSISHRTPQYWWFNITKEDITDEIVGQREILQTFAEIPEEDIRGVRVPFLQAGGNYQFEMMLENNFIYDSSLSVPAFHDPIWPYTLDFRMSHRCMVRWCPTESFPGVWEIPLNQQEQFDGTTCAMIDQCTFPETQDQAYSFFNHSFYRHFLNNKAPLGLFFHTKFLKYEKNLEALSQFLDFVLQMPDVWIVSMSQTIDWIRTPTVIEELNEFEPWKCLEKPINPCTSPSTCNFKFSGGERTFRTCTPCPKSYPWIRNTKGEK